MLNPVVIPPTTQHFPHQWLYNLQHCPVGAIQELRIKTKSQLKNVLAKGV